MAVWGLVAAAVLMLAAFLLFPLRIRVQFHRTNGTSSVRVGLRIAFSVRFTWDLRLLEFSPGEGVRAEADMRPGGAFREEISWEKLREEPRLGETPLHVVLAAVDLLQTALFGRDPADDRGRSLGSPALHLVGFPLFLLRFARTCEQWHWETRLGTGDAAATAVLSGGLWGAKSFLYALLVRRVRFVRPPRFAVIPAFDAATFDVALDSIFRFRPGQIIVVILQDAWKKWQKGAGRVGVSQKASH